MPVSADSKYRVFRSKNIEVDFDARQVDVGTVVFANAHAVSSALQDVNGDGLDAGKAQAPR